MREGKWGRESRERGGGREKEREREVLKRKYFVGKTAFVKYLSGMIQSKTGEHVWDSSPRGNLRSHKVPYIPTRWQLLKWHFTSYQLHQTCSQTRDTKWPRCTGWINRPFSADEQYYLNRVWTIPPSTQAPLSDPQEPHHQHPQTEATSTPHACFFCKHFCFMDWWYLLTPGLRSQMSGAFQTLLLTST